jgi:hypothetical protein
MKVLSILLVSAAIIAAGVVGGLWLRDRTAMHAAAEQQEARMKPELEACRQRLAKLHRAWSRYRAEHKNAEPPSFAALVPKYVAAADLFCPTAARWSKEGGSVGQGSLKVDGKEQPVTYGFQWLTSRYPITVKKRGERTPLITCEVHREVLYGAVYKKQLPLGAFDEPNRNGLIAEVANAPVLVVRRGGTVDILARGEE